MDSGEVRLGLPILVFASAQAFDDWLVDEPLESVGGWLRLAKKGGSLVTLSKAEAIDLALCRGWIDGQQHPYDAGSWLTRFTPRRAKSRWSQVNRTRALELMALGRMEAAGLAQIHAAQADGRWEAAYAPASTAGIPADLQASLDAAPDAAAVFDRLPRTDRYAALYRLATAKRQETRARHIAALLAQLRQIGTTPSGS